MIKMICKKEECERKADCVRFTLSPAYRQHYQNFTAKDCSYFLKKKQ